MKKLFLLLAPIALGLMVGCSYDDTELRNTIEQIQDEQEQLKDEQDAMQEQIDAQQALLNALANNLMITNVAQTEDGFVVTFSDGSAITIKHGKDGEKGDKGDTGAQGEQGEKGDKGDTGAQGEQGEKGDTGDTFFTDVIVGENEVTFILADGTEITIPLSGSENTSAENNKIYYTTTDGNIVKPYKDTGFGANIVSNTYKDGQGVLTFDDSVTSIGEYAFRGCTSLTSVTIGNGVTEIGTEAFKGCTSLKSVTIPNSVMTIGYCAFDGCTSLTSITIPDSVTKIEPSAFARCTSLTSITIPDSVTEIGSYAVGGHAFVNCPSLTSFYGKFASEDNRCLIVDGKLVAFAPAGLTEYTIPDSITSIGDWAFAYYSSLTSVTIPDSVTSIGRGAFYDCISLTSVTIGNGVTTIGSSAFEECTSLISVTIPNSVTEIGSYAFYDCTSLTSVYCKPITPPFGGSAMFAGTASDCKIYVPAASVGAYKSAAGWSGFATIVGYDF